MFFKDGQQYNVNKLMDGLAKVNNAEEETVSGLANEGRESLGGKTIKHISIAGWKWCGAMVLR